MEFNCVAVLWRLALVSAIICSSHSLHGRADEDCPEGSEADFCDDCRTLLLCPIDIRIDCEPFYCHQPANGEATCSQFPRCFGSPLLCAQEGIFPDPYFCSLYHKCPETVGEYSTVQNCPSDFGYNIVTGECDLPLDDPLCLGTPVPECTRLFQSGALQNREYYYKCVDDESERVLYPKLYQCLNGTMFDDVMFDCSYNPMTTEPTTTTTEGSTDTDGTDLTTEENTTPDVDPATKDYTITIIVGSVVAAVVVIGGGMGGYCYLKQRKRPEAVSRKLSFTVTS